GSHEILLDDATRLAARAAAADVAVTLEVTPGVPHVFQVFTALLDEADAALTRAGAFLRAHLAAAVEARVGDHPWPGPAEVPGAPSASGHETGAAGVDAEGVRRTGASAS
ncbi:MAG: alpha/beta hydrolase, partial [Frondihabitans sp.]|nr:alpha/beta hydrolase [Frondihabitans sp.]